MDSLKTILQRCRQKGNRSSRQRKTVISPAFHKESYHLNVYCAHGYPVPVDGLEQVSITCMPLGWRAFQAKLICLAVLKNVHTTIHTRQSQNGGSTSGTHPGGFVFIPVSLRHAMVPLGTIWSSRTKRSRRHPKPSPTVLRCSSTSLKNRF